MAHYLIEFRFFGKTKRDIKKLIWDVNKRFKIRPKNRPVPHVTLVGPLKTRNQKKLISDFTGLCKKHGTMDFKVDGYNTFEDSKVVFIHIEPSEKLKQFRWELARMVKPYCFLRPFDLEKNFKFHATIAMKLNPRKFAQIKRYIKTKPKPNYHYTLLRIALIRNQRILYEYDFMIKRLLNRREAKNKAILSKTFKSLERQLPLIKSEKWKTKTLDRIEPKESLFYKFLNIFRKNKNNL